MGILLTILSSIVSFALYPLILIYSLFRYKEFKNADNHYFKIAVAIDQLGNVVACYLFNDIMIKKEGHKFGLPDETISSVIGKNYKSNTLTMAGKAMRWILDKIEYNHSVNSIEEDEI